MTSVVLEEGVTSIGNSAFAGCENLEEVSIPGSVTTIGTGAFDGAEKLETASYGGVSAMWSAVKGASRELPGATVTVTCAEQYTAALGDLIWTLDKNGSLSVSGQGALPSAARQPWPRRSVTALSLGAEVTGVSTSTFTSYTALTAIDVAAGSEGYYAEDGVLFAREGDGLTLICYPQAREGERYVAPEGVAAIEGLAFYNALGGLTTVNIPNTVTSIGAAPFLGTDVTDLYFRGTEAQWEAVSKRGAALEDIEVHFDAVEQGPDQLFQSLVLTTETGSGQSGVHKLALTLNKSKLPEDRPYILAATYDAAGRMLALEVAQVREDGTAALEVKAGSRDARLKVFALTAAGAPLDGCLQRNIA